MADVTQVLVRAKELIEKGFTKGAPARSEEGRAVPSVSEFATSWCSVGAIRKSCFESGSVEMHAPAFEILSRQIEPKEFDHDLNRERLFGLHRERIAAFNDEPKTTQADVVALFDAAIAASITKENHPCT